jgi:hypothetical protein
MVQISSLSTVLFSVMFRYVWQNYFVLFPAEITKRWALLSKQFGNCVSGIGRMCVPHNKFSHTPLGEGGVGSCKY